MIPQVRDRVRRGVLLLLLSVGATASGCSTTKPSTDYLKSLQQTAMRGELAKSGSVDVATECPTCTPDETIFAERIAGAEHGFGAGCKGMPVAQASYRQITTIVTPGNSIPEYQTFVMNRMCQVAEQYQACTAPGHRLVPIGDATAPVGALTAAIDQCRESNPAEADEILDRAIALETESINRSILSGDFKQARPELRVYAALPRSSQQRAEQWRTTIAGEESEEKTTAARTSAQVKNMVCDDSYFVRNPETGYGTTVAGMNMLHGGRIGPDNPFEPVSKTDTKESRMAVLIWELTNVEELSATEAQEMLQSAYERAAKDPSYCGASH